MAVLFLGVAAAAPLGVARAAPPDIARLFGDRDVCFELYDLNARKTVLRSDARHCATRLSPCSTFKVALALMAFDSGVFADERASMKWDGKDYGRSVWNRDQTALSWMRESVVWFSQRLTPKLGLERVQHYLKLFAFGNEDMSGGLTHAWLDSSLTISPDEQLRFLIRLFRGELPVSKHALEKTELLTRADTSASGWTLHGKTGSGYVAPSEQDKPHPKCHGWYVGQVMRGSRAYVFVTSYVDRSEPADERPPGFIARDLTKTMLSGLGLY